MTVVADTSPLHYLVLIDTVRSFARPVHMTDTTCARRSWLEYNGRSQMGRNRKLRKRRAGQERVIADHENKIREERAKPVPNESYISGWQREIEVARKTIERLTRRLKREW